MSTDAAAAATAATAEGPFGGRGGELGGTPPWLAPLLPSRDHARGRDDSGEAEGDCCSRCRKLSSRTVTVVVVVVVVMVVDAAAAASTVVAVGAVVVGGGGAAAIAAGDQPPLLGSGTRLRVKKVKLESWETIEEGVAPFGDELMVDWYGCERGGV